MSCFKTVTWVFPGTHTHTQYTRVNLSYRFQLDKYSCFICNAPGCCGASTWSGSVPSSPPGGDGDPEISPCCKLPRWPPLHLGHQCCFSWGFLIFKNHQMQSLNLLLQLMALSRVSSFNLGTSVLPALVRVKRNYPWEGDPLDSRVQQIVFP